jgi:hypothetical protein
VVAHHSTRAWPVGLRVRGQTRGCKGRRGGDEQRNSE